MNGDKKEKDQEKKVEIEKETDNANDANSKREEINDVDVDKELEEILNEGEEGKKISITKEEYDYLKEKEKESESLVEKYKRAQADLVNFKKRSEKEKSNLAKFYLQDFVLELMSVIDDFDRAINNAEEAKSFNQFLEGIKLIDKSFKNILKEHGVKEIKALHEKFDPNFHEAVMQEESDEFPGGTVIEELQKGYTLNQRVIRASKVKVAKMKSEEEKK